MMPDDLLPLKEHCYRQLRILRERHREELEPILQMLGYIEAMAAPRPQIVEQPED